MNNYLKPFTFRIVLRRYEAILVGSILLLSGAVMPSNWEPPLRSVPTPQVILPPARPWIALTFDDGPHPGMTDRLLEVLNKENVPGTFFVVGKMADRHPDLLRTIARDGHEIANHTYNHPNLSRISDEEIMTELDRTREVVQRLRENDPR